VYNKIKSRVRAIPTPVCNPLYKALEQEAVKKYIPAVNTAENLASLFKRIGRAWEAEELYSHLSAWRPFLGA